MTPEQKEEFDERVRITREIAHVTLPILRREILLAADADLRALRDRVAALEGAIDAHREAVARDMAGIWYTLQDWSPADAALYAVREGKG